MFIHKLRLQNYRCFSDETFSFDKKFVLIEGSNGSGKTTILEALHYGCFLKSFRTNQVRDLLAFNKNHFFLKVQFDEEGGDSNQVQVGISLEENQKTRPKRLVRFNKKVIKSYRDLISRYRIVSLTEDDLQLVQGAPDIRRYFLNQLSVLFNPDSVNSLKKYKQIKEHRNTILATISERELGLSEELKIWSRQLWQTSVVIQKERIKHLEMLQDHVNNLLASSFPSLNVTISFQYNIKNNIWADSFQAFWKKYKEKQLHNEWRWRRGLFGAHLDDFTIIFREKEAPLAKARNFASRGQQKLVLFLIKVALAQRLEELNMQVALLLDDFLTDFDHERLTNCLSLLSKLSCQVFITCPLKKLITSHYTENADLMQIISL